MTTRKTAGSERGVPSGYGGFSVIEPRDAVPPCTIEDVDRALFKAFDEEIVFQVIEKGGITKRVPVIFATGERFALVRRRKPIRDENGAIILPLISIRRTRIDQDDITERGINQFTGDIVVKRKISSEDVAWQRLVNKPGFTSTDDAALDASVDAEGSPRMRALRDVGRAARSLATNDGALLAPELGNNVFEFITIPQPQFYTATYEVTFSTQYTQHMNDVMQQLMSSFLPQGRNIRIESQKGYWFVASFDESTPAVDTLDEFSEKERLVTSTIGCSVRAYLIAGGTSGETKPARRWFSAPQIRFDVVEDDPPGKDAFERADDPGSEFLLTDPNERSFNHNPSARERNRGDSRPEQVKNPFTGKREPRHVRSVHVDPGTGESIFKSS